MTMVYLSAILRYFNIYNYEYREDLPIVISDFLESHLDVTLQEFESFINSLNYDFFYLNRINKKEFSQDIYNIFIKTKSRYRVPTKYDYVKKFIEEHIEIGLNPENVEKRQGIINNFNKISSPHENLMKLFNEILTKIKITYQLDLHGVKEYSGVDIIKKYRDANIGFQIKSKNDDISEDRIRSQTSKALERKLDSFVLIYGRKRTKTVETSIQAAYHYFQSLKDKKQIYCFIIPPELFAELIIIYEVEF